MRYVSTFLQLTLFATFVFAYAFAIIPAIIIVACRKPVIRPAPARVRTTIGNGSNIRRIY
jgi:hypothetical protein